MFKYLSMIALVVAAFILPASSSADSEFGKTIAILDFTPAGSSFVVMGEATITNNRRGIAYQQHLSVICTGNEYEKRSTKVADIAGNVRFFQNSITVILVESNLPPLETIHCELEVAEITQTRRNAFFTANAFNISLQLVP